MAHLLNTEIVENNLGTLLNSVTYYYDNEDDTVTLFFIKFQFENGMVFCLQCGSSGEDIIISKESDVKKEIERMGLDIVLKEMTTENPWRKFKNELFTRYEITDKNNDGVYNSIKLELEQKTIEVIGHINGLKVITQ